MVVRRKRLVKTGHTAGKRAAAGSDDEADAAHDSSSAARNGNNNNDDNDDDDNNDIVLSDAETPADRSAQSMKTATPPAKRSRTAKAASTPPSAASTASGSSGLSGSASPASPFFVNSSPPSMLTSPTSTPASAKKFAKRSLARADNDAGNAYDEDVLLPVVTESDASAAKSRSSSSSKNASTKKATQSTLPFASQSSASENGSSKKKKSKTTADDEADDNDERNNNDDDDDDDDNDDDDDDDDDKPLRPRTPVLKKSRAGSDGSSSNFFADFTPSSDAALQEKVGWIFVFLFFCDRLCSVLRLGSLLRVLIAFDTCQFHRKLDDLLAPHADAADVSRDGSVPTSVPQSALDVAGAGSTRADLLVCLFCFCLLACFLSCCCCCWWWCVIATAVTVRFVASARLCAGSSLTCPFALVPQKR